MCTKCAKRVRHISCWFHKQEYFKMAELVTGDIYNATSLFCKCLQIVGKVLKQICQGFKGVMNILSACFFIWIKKNGVLSHLRTRRFHKFNWSCSLRMIMWCCYITHCLSSENELLSHLKIISTQDFVTVFENACSCASEWIANERLEEVDFSVERFC